jgi:hypothetical protein
MEHFDPQTGLCTSAAHRDEDGGCICPDCPLRDFGVIKLHGGTERRSSRYGHVVLLTRQE